MPGPAAASPAARSCSTASISLDASDEPMPRAPGPRIAYVAQVAAASFNPAHRLIDQVIESAARATASIGAGRGRRRRRRPLPPAAACPIPRRFGERYPHQVSGGQLQRAMTAMAMSCRPDLIVFDEPTTALDVTTQIEVLAAIKRHRRRSSTPRRSTSPTTSPWWPRWPTASWCCATAELVEEAPTRADARGAAGGLHQGARGRCASSHTHERAERRRRCCASTTSPPAYGGAVKVLENVTVAACRAAGPWRSSANPAPASRRWRASSPACCRRSQGAIIFDGKRAAAGAQGPRQGHAAPHPDDLSDARHRAQPAPDGARHHRPAARILSRPARRARATAARRRAARA